METSQGASVSATTPAEPAATISNGGDEVDEQPRPSSPSPSSSTPAEAAPVASTSTSSAPPKKVVLLRRPSPPPPASSSPASPSRTNESADKEAAEELSKKTEQLHITEEKGGAEAGKEEAGPPTLDPVVLAALSHPRDRFLLLRAEVELERFVASTSSTRLPLAPPHFPPALNSYQRLLVHRLADTFGITREVEAASSLWNSGPVINPATGQPQGVVVLVKGEATKLPPAKLATYVPAPEATPPAVPVLTPAPAPISTATTASPAISAVPSPAVSINPALPTTSASPSPVTPEPQRIFKILPRSSASRTASAASSSIGDDDSNAASGSGKGKGRKDLTLEEREAAYKEARERIFSQPDPERPAPPLATASTASSGASELGMGITRPSSAGSTFSRSSAALSISGARPSPSLASESSSIRSGYTGYYAAPPPPMQYGVAPGYPNLRSSAPVFDPASGGWTYPQQQQQQPDYGYGGDYGRTPPGSQPYFPPYHPAAPVQPAYPGQPQPPIQVTAPSPHSQAASYAYGTPAAPAFNPATYPQQPPYDPSPTWSQPSHRSLPSPALSASSGASMPHHQQHFAQRQQQQPPPASTASSSTGGSSGAGYLMRFADGSVVTPGGSITTPGAAGGSTSRSVGSLSSTSVSSLNSSARAGLPRSAAASGGSRRLSASTTHSVGSVSAISSAALDDSSRKSPTASTSVSGASSSKAPSEADSGAGASEGKRRDRQTTIVGGRPEQGSVKGKGKERASVEGAEEAEDDSKPLHPSLPSKPAWVATQPPQVREPPSTSSSAPFSTAPQVDPTPAPLPPISYPSQPPQPQSALPPYPAPSSAAVLPPPEFFPSVQPPPPPTASSAWGARAAVPPAQYAPPPSDFPALGGAVPPPPFYPPQQPAAPPPPPPAPYPYGAPSAPSAWGPPSLAAPGVQPTHCHPNLPLQQQQARAFDPKEDLMSMPDMRRPPPRSTQLFDPSKPSVGARGKK